jgi:hypothetical protein
MSRLGGWTRPYRDQIFVPRLTSTSAVRLDSIVDFNLGRCEMQLDPREVVVFIDQVRLSFPLFRSLGGFGAGSATLTTDR